MKKTTKTKTMAECLERARTMPQDKFDAKADELLREATAALMALETMIVARRAKA